MADVFSKEKRSEIMSCIKCVDTKPERLVRSISHGMGFRFRLHVKDLPGKPDLVFPRHRKVIFVNGCFWHGHRNCRKSSLPQTNKSFWEKKIIGNIDRDRRNAKELKHLGWKVLHVWECETRHTDKLYRKIHEFLMA